MKRGRPSDHVKLFSMHFTNPDGSIEVYKYRNKMFDLVSIVIPENVKDYLTQVKTSNTIDPATTIEAQRQLFPQMIIRKDDTELINSKNPEKTDKTNFIDDLSHKDNEFIGFASNKNYDIEDTIAELAQGAFNECDRYFSLDISNRSDYFAPILYTEKDNQLDIDDLENYDIL